MLLSTRTKTSGCKLGPNPDRRCSPGAYYSKLTKAVICPSSFRTIDIRNVPQSEKFAVEVEYGMRPAYYDGTLEIDHIKPRAQFNSCRGHPRREPLVKRACGILGALPSEYRVVDPVTEAVGEDRVVDTLTAPIAL